MNIKRIKIILVAFLFFGTLLAFTPNLPTTTRTATATTVVLSNPVQDGRIEYNGGVITLDKQVDALREATNIGGGLRYMSYMEWDISAIPDTATITNVGFNVYADGYNTPAGVNYADFCGITIQPSAQTNNTAGWTALYTNIWTQVGTQYKQMAHTSFVDNNYININDTGGTAWDISPKADIQSQLPADWFAMSFTVGAGDAGYYASIDSENNTEGHIAPTLWIEYQITTPVIEDSSPSDEATNVNLTPNLCVNVSYTQFSAIDNYYRRMVIESDYILNPLLNHPILVTIDSATAAKCNGGDSLQFWADGNTSQFKHEVELWNESGTSYVWVNITHINSSTDTVFWMKYGNAGWSNSEDRKNTWDSYYTLVYHMNSTVTNVIDSTEGLWHNGTKENVASPEEVEGKIAESQDFELDDTEYITAANHADFGTANTTVEYWCKPETLADSDGIINKNADAVGTNSWTHYITAAGEYRTYILSDGGGTCIHRIYVNKSYENGGNGAAYNTGAGLASTGTWSKVTVTYYDYRNGLGGNVDLGLGYGRNGGVKDQFSDVMIDEVRISSCLRNNSWLNSSYDSQNQTLGYLTTGSELENTTSINVNITWYWWNGTAFVEFSRTEGINSNGTYCNNTYTDGLNLTPGTEYWWGARITDANGNYSEDFFSFTTFDVNPPTDLTCNRINATALNITWTPLPDYNGTTYTIIRYLKGYNTPNINEGTELYNGTSYHINLTGLPEATCYGISAWTYWKAPNGTWILSSNKATRICCSAGGDYTVCLRYENTSLDTQNNKINLTLFPCSTHRVVIKYTNGLEQIQYLTNISDNCFTIAAEYDILYIEVWWNYSVNLSCNYNTTTSYFRRLTTNAMWNDSGNNTFDFYFIVDRPIYLDYRTVYPNETIYETDFEDNLVRYSYAYIDLTGGFTGASPNDVFSSIYAFNSTKQLIIHEDYWDAAQKIYPVLLYDKNYWHKTHRISTDISVFLGFCPTAKLLEEMLYIKAINITTDLEDPAISHDWNTISPGGWLYYHDIDVLTSEIYFKLYVNSTDSTPIEYVNLSGTNEWNFTGGKMALLNHTYLYIVEITFRRNATIDVADPQYVTKTATRHFIPGVSAVVTSAHIDTLFEDVFGKSPLYKPGEEDVYIPWSTLLALGIAMMVGFGLVGVDHSGIAPCFGFGITLIGLTFLVSGLTGLYLLGVGVLLLGIILLLGRKK